MDVAAFQRVDRQSWRRIAFYVDITVAAILILSTVLLARHAFEGGQYFERGVFNLSTQSLWNVVADVVFVTVSLSWLLFRLVYLQYLVLTKRF